MSAIIAGKECKMCGKEYWLSFGHPEWFKNRAGDAWQGFCSLKYSGLCPTCFVIVLAERPEASVVSTGELLMASMIADLIVSVEDSK
jgi:hypothetical protein